MTNTPIGHPFESAGRRGETAVPPTPRPTCSRVGATFAQHVVAAVDIGVHDGSITGPIPTASHALPRKHGLFRLICSVRGDRIPIKKTRLAGVAFFLQEDADPDQRRFIDELINKPGMRKLHELLIGARAQVRFLFPERVFPNHQRPDPLAD